MQCDFSEFVEKQGIVSLIGAYFRMMAPTYASGFASSAVVDESDMIHRDYFPVITSIKHLPRKGPQIHAPNDILEIRRAMMFRNFWNTFPYPEEVIRIDRSKLRRQ